MRTTPRRAAFAFASVFTVALLAGCATSVVNELPPGAKVIDGNATVLLDAPVGSHMRKRVKVSEMNQPGIAPTESSKISDNTDTNVMPPTAGEMQRMMSGPVGGR
jgi:hypothetical protein